MQYGSHCHSQSAELRTIKQKLNRPFLDNDLVSLLNV